MIDHKWNEHKWIFNDVDNLGYPFHHIHPYKQNAVKFMVTNKPDWLDHIIVFGSSVKRGHFYEKDLDVCLIGSNVRNIEDFWQIKAPNTRYDIVTVANLDELHEKANAAYGSVYYYILKDGVMVV